MTGISFEVITFVCAFGGALLGMYIRTRLPPAHLIKESDDVIQRGIGLVATMTALLLGVVTAAAKGSFDSTDVAVQSTAAAVLTPGSSPRPLWSRNSADAGTAPARDGAYNRSYVAFHRCSRRSDSVGRVADNGILSSGGGREPDSASRPQNR